MATTECAHAGYVITSCFGFSGLAIVGFAAFLVALRQWAPTFDSSAILVSVRVHTVAVNQYCILTPSASPADSGVVLPIAARFCVSDSIHPGADARRHQPSALHLVMRSQGAADHEEGGGGWLASDSVLTWTTSGETDNDVMSVSSACNNPCAWSDHCVCPAPMLAHL